MISSIATDATRTTKLNGTTFVCMFMAKTMAWLFCPTVVPVAYRAVLGGDNEPHPLHIIANK
jgi:hypothetical protein